jgi:allantoinase
VIDDRPAWMNTTEGPLIAMPYNLEVNDSIVYAIERHATGEMAPRLEFTLRRFETECRDSALVLATGSHPHLIAVPHRIHERERMLDLLTASPDVGFFTGSQLADWYAAAEPATKKTRSSV